MTVKEWIENGCNYDEGVALFAKLSPKSNLNGFFKGDPRFKERPIKLKYELLKIQPSGTNSKKQISKPKMQPQVRVNRVINTNNDSTVDVGKLENNDAYPELIQDAINLYSSLYKQRAIKYNERTALGFDNTADLVSKRKEMSDEIIDMSNKMELLWKVKDEFDRMGTIPEENVASSVESEKDVPLPNSVDELKKLKKNLQTNNSKDGNLLDYQSKAAKQRKTPMPEGPRRTKIEARIKDKIAKIAEIDIKLKALQNETN